MRLAEEALTFDDVLLQPAYSDVLPRDVSLATQLTREISLNIPVISAAMDTVTEARLAIALAQEGGIGIVHKNVTPDQQAQHVRMVKKFESGVIREPITVGPDATIRDVLNLTAKHDISGVPVVDGKELAGIVTSRDLRFETRYDAPVSAVMTPKAKLVTVGESAGRDEAIALLHKHRIEKVLVVNDRFELRGMITVKDIQKAKDYPLASKDEQGRLRVGAAVGTGGDTEERVAALVAAGVDVIVVDTSHGHSKGVLDRVAWIKKHYPDMQVIGGNIVTAEAARALVDAGADLVIGHHPHVLQGIERHGDGIIAYSLGNFVFENTNDPPRLTGVLRVRMQAAERCIERVVFHPAYIKRNPIQHPVPATGFMHRKVTERVTALGKPLGTAWDAEGDDLVLRGPPCARDPEPEAPARDPEAP
jgi:IMP dehydrogenase/GMP reductase